MDVSEIKQNGNCYGVCKECHIDVPLIESNRILDYDIWECPKCAYPNALDDFWQVFEKCPDKVVKLDATR